MKIALAFVAPLPALLVARGALAHEGHGNPHWAGTVFHYLLEPEHALVAVLVTTAFVFLVARIRRWWSLRQRLPGPPFEDRFKGVNLPMHLRVRWAARR